MPIGLDSSDRKLLVGAAAVTLVLAGASAVLAPPTRGDQSPVPSSYSSNSAGALAAYLLLVDLHYDVHRWEETPDRLNEFGSGSVLILAEPTETPTDQERRSLHEFVEKGGRILFCGSSLREFFPGAPVVSVSRPGWEEFSARIPSYVTEGADTIALEPQGEWRTAGPAELSLYGDPSRAAVEAWRIGAGEVLWWAGAAPLTNDGIRRAHNLRLFLNAVSGPTAENRSPAVYWDEYFHGQRASLWSYVEKTPVAWGILQTTILALAVLFSFSRRSGPIATPVAASRLSPLEFVETLGGLYQAAGAASVAVTVSYRRLRLTLTQRLGMPLAIADGTLAEAAARRLGWDEKQFGACLAEAAASEHLEKLRPAEGLALVQKLEGYLAQLRPRKISAPETK